jgi:hypothetical protein
MTHCVDCIMSKRAEELVQLICGSPDHPLTGVLRQWCLSSRPLLDFMETHASKIRRKIRLARSGDEQSDLLAELMVGQLLARDRRFQVQYEPQPLTTARGPDFGAVFKGHIQLYVEVTRIQPPQQQVKVVSKLARVLCDKVAQGVPGAMNVLAVVLPAELQSATLVQSAVQMLQAPVQGPDAPVIGPADRLTLTTYRRLQGRLSGVLLCSFTPEGDVVAATLWANPQAKRPLLPDIARFLSAGSAGVQAQTAEKDGER